MVEQMLRVWEEVFGHPVGLDDDFFEDLNGDSVQLLQLLTGISDVFQVPLSMDELIDQPNPARLIQIVAVHSGSTVPPTEVT